MTRKLLALRPQTSKAIECSLLQIPRRSRVTADRKGARQVHADRTERCGDRRRWEGNWDHIFWQYVTNLYNRSALR